jgi:adenylate cyclase
MAVSFVYVPSGALSQVQRLVWDATVFRTRAGASARSVVLVHLDEQSIAALKGQYGRVFSWPRSLHAQVLRNLADAGARVVAYDILFDAPGCPASLPPPCQEDVEFARAMEDARTRPGGGTAVLLARDGDPPEPGPLQPGQPPAYRDSIDPLPAFRQNATALAAIHPAPDVDGTVRKMPLLVTMKGEVVPTLSLQAAASYLRRPRAVERAGDGFVDLASRAIPVDANFQAIINFEGPPSHRPDLRPGPVPALSFVDVLNGTFDQEAVKNKIVFVGLTAAGFADDFLVPTSPAGLKMSGVEIHAQTADMILKGGYLQQQGPLSTALVILALTVVSGLILARLQPLVAAGATGVLFLGYVAFTVVQGARAEVSLDGAATFTLFNSVYPGAALLVAFVVVMLYRIVFEQAEQRLTRGTMGKYLSPAVMTEVLKDPQALQLGGQKREMSVLFSDIRGFTSIAERMDPGALVTFLNAYLTEMTDVVFVHEGVLDKYMGDAIMAFWGAPNAQPNHAELACRTAYHMAKRLHELQATWVAQGLPALEVGIGINSGPMTVGNVGSRIRFDYTVMGDAVNLGSRLEGINKEYGTTIVVGEGTYRDVKDTFVVRYLDLIAVAGKQKGTAIYELIAPVEEVAAQSPDGLLAAWDAAVDLYRSRRFEEAGRAFERVLEIKPDDPPARVFVARCRALALEPPGPGWDGVYVMTHK